MRDVFSNASKDQPRAKLSLYEPSLRDTHEFRELMQKSVLYLSTLLTFGGFLNMYNRGEIHVSMWLSLGVSGVALICAVRVSSSSPDDWLERAYEALYSVKEAGGDAARMAT